MQSTTVPETVPRHRLTVRARLALTYAGLVTLAGIVLLVIVSIFLVYVPSYSFGDTATLIAEQYPSGLDAQPALPTSETSDADTVVVYPSILLSPADAITVGSRDDVLRLLLGVSAVAILILATAGAGAGWIVAGRMLRPLQYVNAAAHRAASGRFDHRIALVGPRDEISDLADAFDDVLGEIEHSLQSQRRFTANASHELRTPLATSRTMIDVALRSPMPPQQREVLLRLRETNERSVATVESLLDLAEIEASVRKVDTVDLAELADTVLDESVREAAERGVEMCRELEPVIVTGDEVLLRQLLVNLTHNAIRHNQRGGSATIRTRLFEGLAMVEMSNTGLTIATDAIDHLVDPFYRGHGRTRDAALRGRGLGLSIVAAIVERHDGELSLAARDGGGLVVRILFPEGRGSHRE